MKTTVAVILCACGTVQAQLAVNWEARADRYYIVQSTSSGLQTRYWKDLQTLQQISGPQSVVCNPVGPSGFYRVLVSDTPLFTWGWDKFSQAEYLSPWILGTNEISHTDLDKPYLWYRDQATTGWAALNNCGPTCTEMAARWYDPNTTCTAESARNMYPNGGGWWYTSWVTAALTSNNIPNRIIGISGAGDITNLLANGSICILCIDLYYIPIAQGGEWRGHGMYSLGPGSGHMIVCKGFRVTDTETWIECYDPASNTYHYLDGVLAGINRHYSYSEISNATQHWWAAAIVIDAPGKKMMLADNWLPVPAPQHAP